MLSLPLADQSEGHHLSGTKTDVFFHGNKKNLHAKEAFMGQMNIVPVLGESFNQVGATEKLVPTTSPNLR